jgi:hypothetical protein
MLILFCVGVGNADDESEVNGASIFRVKVESVSTYMYLRNVGNSAYIHRMQRTKNRY